MAEDAAGNLELVEVAAEVLIDPHRDLTPSSCTSA
jgi:hypothetical protein